MQAMIEHLMIRENWEQALWIGFAIFVGMPIIISAYYHINVRRIRGGRRLMQAQSRLAPMTSNVAGNLSNGFEMWSRLRRGEFGRDAQMLIWNCTVGMVAWVAIITVWFGVLLYVDAQMMNNGGWPGYELDPPPNAAPETFHGMERMESQ